MKAIRQTRMAKRYSDIQFKDKEKRKKGPSGSRLDEAHRILEGDGVQLLADDFTTSLEEAGEDFSENDRSDEALYEDPRELTEPPGVESSLALGSYFDGLSSNQWTVPGDPGLNFFYVDRELVSTRAPGARLEKKVAKEKPGTTADGPRVDLLLANAKTRRPILAELKLTSRSGPDKDPFYALIQALASAAYLLPPNQIKRLSNSAHDQRGRIDKRASQIDLYLVIGREPQRSDNWFELRDRAADLAMQIAPLIKDRVPTIAGLELYWNDRAEPKDKLIIKKWFSTANS